MSQASKVLNEIGSALQRGNVLMNVRVLEFCYVYCL